MFDLQSPFSPSGDQPQVIDALIRGIESGRKMQALKGVTGSGKTLTMANVNSDGNICNNILSTVNTAMVSDSGHSPTTAAQ